MKQKLLTLLLALMMLCNLIGCSLFTPFKLREETITMEYGEELSEDVSTYVTARNYDEVTYDYSNAYPGIFGYANHSNGTATFTNAKGETLTLNIEWVDTTAPAISQTTFDLYKITLNAITDGTCPDTYDGWDCHCYHELATPSTFDGWWKYGSFMIIEDYSSVCDVSNIVYDGISLESTITGYNYEEAESGEHTLSFTLTDLWGNSSNHEVKINVYYDVSPENRELLYEQGYTDEEIDARVEEIIEHGAY